MEDVAKNILKLRYLCAVGGLLEALSKKQAKPRGFRFKPMYFNAEKAEFNARLEKLRTERDANDNGHYIPHDFKGTFSKRLRRGNTSSKPLQLYNLRLLFILTVALILTYLLFQTSLIDNLTKQFLDVFSKKNGLY